MLVDDILTLRHTDDEWIELEEEANTYFKELTEEQLDYFAESGAGEALGMACSGIRLRRNKKEAS